MPKPFWDLSLATVFVLEQVSIINELKETKECRDERLLSDKRSNNSIVYLLPGMRDLSSLTRDGTRARCIDSMKS